MKRLFQPGRPWLLWMVMAAGAVAVAGHWWYSLGRAEIGFLPRLTPAEWIVYPTPTDPKSQSAVELPGIFKTSFDLKEVPPRALLRVAGFHRYALALNETPVDQPLRVGKNWKQPDLFDVSGRLRAGANRIEVTVFNSNGPPALWLFLDAGASKVSTGADWQASYAGATWRAAALAAKPKFIPVGSPTYGGEQPGAAFRARWPALLVFALLSAAGCWALSLGRAALPRGQDETQLVPTDGSDETQLVPTGRGRNLRRELIPIVVMAGFWVALFANNLDTLPRVVGFDVEEHLEYIGYIQQHGSLPLAGQGWEMFQPPLYYLVSAGFLNLLSLSVSEPGGLMAVRLLGLIFGVTSFAAVWATLRLLFPKDAPGQLRGLLLAACLPPVLYLSQYISNEGMGGALASVCLYLCLRVLQQEQVSWKACAGLGLCLGAALLTKATTVLLVPVIFGALLWRQLEKRQIPMWPWPARMGVIFGLCAVVGGWHYARTWLHYGNPLIGNWDPRTGHPWWQDDGYRTSAYYLQFGEVLRHPWFAGFKSYWDGLYSTLWGDGMLSGVRGIVTRPLWNFDLMGIGYWLSLLPALAVVAGAFLALLKFIRQPSAEWFLLLGFGLLMAWALVYMSLVIPCGGQSKAFYGLPALVPFCACGAWGLDFLAGRRRFGRFLLCLGIGLWAMNSYASFWVLRSSVSYARTRSETLVLEKQFVPAARFLKAHLASESDNTELRVILVVALLGADDLDEAERQVQIAARQEPHNGEVWQWQAAILLQRRELDHALEAARRSVELAPGRERAYQQLATILMEQKQYEDAARIARDGLGMAAFSLELRETLCSALLFMGQQSEAAAQFQYAYGLSPRSADRLDQLAWKLATAEDAAERNGAVAVKLAEEICVLTKYQKAVCISTLAAAYAEAGRYEEAIQTAERARASALDSGEARLAVRCQQMLDRFRSGQPYQDSQR